MEVAKCIECGGTYNPKRKALGYSTCTACGEQQAETERQGWCIVPMHKSNYFLCTDKRDLKGINNKGGLVR